MFVRHRPRPCVHCQQKWPHGHHSGLRHFSSGTQRPAFGSSPPPEKGLSILSPHSPVATAATLHNPHLHCDRASGCRGSIPGSTLGKMHIEIHCFGWAPRCHVPFPAGRQAVPRHFHASSTRGNVAHGQRYWVCVTVRRCCFRGQHSLPAPHRICEGKDTSQVSF